MFKLKSKGIGQGFFMSPIKYEVRLESGDWSAFFGDYENQKWGSYDSNSCWALGGSINETEDQLEFLMKTNQFSSEAIDFFKKNNYIDEDGDFSLSERFIEIISGAHDNGNDQMEAWRIPQEFAGNYGFIPRSILNYSNEQAAKFFTKEAFNADYFNKNAITDEIYALGKEFLKYVKISRQWIGMPWKTPFIEILRAALKQAPLSIGVPVPKDVSMWNRTFVQYDGSVSCDHCIELYAIDDKGQYLIFDQYEPHLKTLSADYLLAVVTQGIVEAKKTTVINPIIQDKKENSFWTGVMNWFNQVFGNSDVGYVGT